MLFATTVVAAASTEFVIYSFPGGNRPLAAGCKPQNALVADSAGNLYGTSLCGAFESGTVFELSPPVPPSTEWTETALYTLTGGTDGKLPASGVIFDEAGNLYGTTHYGGANGLGCGTVFELSPPTAGSSDWAGTILHIFPATTKDGAAPISGVMLGKNGELYGVTPEGGAHGEGAVYAIIP